MKKNFKYDDTVEIINTESHLDGTTVNVVGRIDGEIVDMYIVQFDFVQRNHRGEKYLCIVLPESNLQLFSLSIESTKAAAALL